MSENKLDITLRVTILDRVLVDRSAGQHEPGWWVVADNYTTDDDRNDGLFFLSEDGTLYGHDGNASWATAIGTQPGLAEMAARTEDDFLVPIPGRPGWRRDSEDREWYSSAWLDADKPVLGGGRFRIDSKGDGQLPPDTGRDVPLKRVGRPE